MSDPTPIMRNGTPVVGFGQAELLAPAAAAAAASSSPWALALATSVVSAAAGWALEEIAGSIRGRRK